MISGLSSLLSLSGMRAQVFRMRLESFRWRKGRHRSNCLDTNPPAPYTRQALMRFDAGRRARKIWTKQAHFVKASSENRNLEKNHERK